jgi:copper chaperone NosL
MLCRPIHHEHLFCYRIKILFMKKWMISILIVYLITGCKPVPEPIRYGYDSCDFCRMTIVDNRFGGELVTSKGKVYKFDAAECLDDFYHQAHESFAWVLFVDFNHPGTFIPAQDAFLLQSTQLHSPMGKGIAAFQNEQQAKEAQKRYGGEIKRCELP